MGLRVAVQTDVAHLCGGNQGDHGIHHAQTGSQNGNDRQLLTCQHAALCHSNRGLHVYLDGWQVAGSFITHQRGDFAYQLTEFLDTGVLVTQDCQLMLDQRVVQNSYICHLYLSPFNYVSLFPDVPVLPGIISDNWVPAQRHHRKDHDQSFPLPPKQHLQPVGASGAPEGRPG